ncbi:MAG: hypothetical protein M3Z36_08510, partial [Acidobacteriota bacterium]|nr:hypothetical protein [Acidobacteriota bacterium]
RLKTTKEGEQAATFHVNAGLASLKQGKLAVAERQFRQGLALAPQAGRLHRLLSETLERRNKSAEALVERKLADELDTSRAPR